MLTLDPPGEVWSGPACGSVDWTCLWKSCLARPCGMFPSTGHAYFHGPGMASKSSLEAQRRLLSPGIEGRLVVAGQGSKYSPGNWSMMQAAWGVSTETCLVFQCSSSSTTANVTGPSCHCKAERHKAGSSIAGTLERDRHASSANHRQVNHTSAATVKMSVLIHPAASIIRS